jgi:hypothetical protein
MAYFGEMVVGGRAGRSPTVVCSVGVGEIMLAPDWLRAARMPLGTGLEQSLCARSLGDDIEGKTRSEFLA